MRSEAPPAFPNGIHLDWYVETENPESLPALRHAIGEHLRRHATPDSDVPAAELAVSEMITNAIEHAGGDVWVSLDWGSERPELTVRDLGPSFELDHGLVPPPPESVRGRGLFIVAALTGDLRVASRKAGGSTVSTDLPVRRAAEPSYDPPRRSVGVLPGRSEAREDGTFDRQSFLRALVVQLAQAEEDLHGPAAAEAAVAQVGSDVGGRMEEAYREARGIQDDLSPEQMADLYVKLKGAIDGDFYVIDMDEDRIVLGNRRCPFGDAVKLSPSLCRTTSSVFGGIAARNGAKASVQLEERIAVGDPECRVIVWLRDPPEDARTLVHFYGSEGSRTEPMQSMDGD